MRLFIVLLIIVLPLALLVVGITISKLSDSWFIKPSAFECGFEEISSSRLSFSLKFFLIVLVFLIFDVEIALILPLPLRRVNAPLAWIAASWVIFFILLWGLYLEATQGSLSWVE